MQRLELPSLFNKYPISNNLKTKEQFQQSPLRTLELADLLHETLYKHKMKLVKNSETLFSQMKKNGQGSITRELPDGNYIVIKKLELPQMEGKGTVAIECGLYICNPVGLNWKQSSHFCLERITIVYDQNDQIEEIGIGNSGPLVMNQMKFDQDAAVFNEVLEKYVKVCA